MHWAPVICSCLYAKPSPSYSVISVSSLSLTRQCTIRANLVCVIELRTRTKSLFLFKEYIDRHEPIAGPSALRHDSLESDQSSESEPEFAPGSDEEPDYNESEDEQEQVQLQPAENEIEDDFECVLSFSIGLILHVPYGFPSM